MALALEDTIMREIGLEQHFSWFNGGGSCQSIRKKAADRLKDAIQRHHDKGEAIASPDTSLVIMLKQIAANGDLSPYSLTNTWQAASYVIAEHIHQATATEPQRQKSYERLNIYLKEHFLPTDYDTFLFNLSGW